MGRKSTSNLYKALQSYRFTIVELQNIIGVDYSWETKIAQAGFVFDEYTGHYYFSDLYIEKLIREMPFVNSFFDTKHEEKSIFSPNNVLVFFAISGGLDKHLKSNDIEGSIVAKFCQEYHSHLLVNAGCRDDFASDWNREAGILIGLDTQFTPERTHAFDISTKGIDVLFNKISQVTGIKYPTEGIKQEYEKYREEHNTGENLLRNV